MNATELITKMRLRHMVKSDQSVGIAGFHCKEAVVAEDERDIEAIMTTADVDLDDEVVLPGGVDTSYFAAMSQRKVFIDHDYSMGSNVGVARFINPFPNAQAPIGLKARIHIYRGLKNPLCDDLLERIKQGGMGLSVGFVPLVVGAPTPEEKKAYPGAESVVRKWKMLEVSFTSLPCNVKCQTMMSGPVEPKRLVIEREPRRIVLG